MSHKYNIYLRKDGRYEGRVPIGRTANGNLSYKYLYHRDEKKLKLMMDAEQRNQCAPCSDVKMQFNCLFDMWYESKIGKVRESTLAIYRCHLDAHLRPILGKKYLSTLTAEKLNELCKTTLAMRNDGKGRLSAKTQMDVLRTLNNVLKFGMRNGYINRHLQAEYPKAEQKRMNVLREKELEALEAVLHSHFHQRESIGIVLSLYTGLRVGELCGLCWEDIDLENGMLYVQRTIQRIGVQGQKKKTAIIIGEPKSAKSKREIPIPDHLLTVLRELKCGQNSTFFLSDSTKCYEPRRMQAAFHRYLDMAGLSRRGIHCTRHTFATRWVEQGIDIKTLSEILGHTNIRITLDKYVHISEKVKRENINKIKPTLSFDLGKPSRQNLITKMPYAGSIATAFVNEQI